MVCCCKKTDPVVYVPENNMPMDKVLRVTAFVTLLLALLCLAISYTLKGVSLLPHKYTQGLEHIYGLSSICFKRATVIFAAISLAVFVLGIAVRQCKRDEIKQSASPEQDSRPLNLVPDSVQSV
jgi:hypothetical protein